MLHMDDTIAAISTAVGESGIGIVRVSGPEALRIGDRVFFPARRSTCLADASSHTVHYGLIKDGDETIDEVLVSVFRSPRSYTTEDTIEINGHGGRYALQRILQTVFKNGAKEHKEKKSRPPVLFPNCHQKPGGERNPLCGGGRGSWGGRGEDAVNGWLRGCGEGEKTKN